MPHGDVFSIFENDRVESSIFDPSYGIKIHFRAILLISSWISRKSRMGLKSGKVEIKTVEMNRCKDLKEWPTSHSIMRCKLIQKFGIYDCHGSRGRI